MDKNELKAGLTKLLNRSEGERQFTLHILKSFGGNSLPETSDYCETFEQILIRGGLEEARKKTYLREPSQLQLPTVYRVLSSVKEASNDRNVRIGGYTIREGENEVIYVESNFIPFSLLYNDKEISVNKASFILSFLIRKL